MSHRTKAPLDASAKHAASETAEPVKDGIDVKTVERNPADKGFVPQPKRWVVEQAYGILALHRRLVRDYEHRLASSESRVYWAMSDVMARRLTGTAAPAWRGT